MRRPLRVISLDGIRTDGWFDRVAAGMPQFKELGQVIGERFVAFAVIAGVRITGLIVDRRSPDASLVDFAVGEETTEQRLPLGEFRRRLASALLTEEPGPVVDLDAPTLAAEQIQEAIGFRYVLLAPIFGMRLTELHTGGGRPTRVVVEAEGADRRDEIPLDELHDIIRDRIRAEVQKSRPQSPFAIDLGAVPEAERALADGDPKRVVELLGAWPGPLSLLLRTAEGQQLAPEVKSTLARALGMLGAAYAQTQRFDWAEEVMRLGIQWGQESSASGELFWRLGQTCVARDRHGEAIGLLRRALTLGASPRLVLPLLAVSYRARGRWVAAAVCADRAVQAGASGEELDSVRQAAASTLGAPWEAFRKIVPARTSQSTLPPPRGP